MPELKLEWMSEEDWVVVSGLAAAGPVDVESWPGAAAPGLVPAVGALWRLVEDEVALAQGNELHLPHAEAAALSPAIRSALGLPAAPPVTLFVQHQDTIDRDAFRVDHRWHHLDGRPVLGAKRDGAFLTLGTRRYLLPSELFEIAAAIDRFNALPATDPDGRAAAWMDVQELLPTLGDRGPIDASPYLRQVRVAHAGAFTLRPFERDGEIDFDPVLFAAKPGGSDEVTEGEPLDRDGAPPVDPEPLLPEHLQKAFADARFRQFTDARGRYALPDGWLLILSPPLRKAMGVARQVQRAGGEVARDFVRNPRGYLREALGGELDEHLVEELFRETREFSERVHAIGLWQKKVLPWVQVPREPWLPPEVVGLVVDGAPIQLPAERISELADRIRDAIDQGRPEVVFDGTSIPATEQTLASLGEIQRALAGGEAKLDSAADESADGKGDEDAPGGREPTGGTEPHVLLVRNNFEEVVFNSDPAPRVPPVDAGLHEALLRSVPKPHQREGVDWLQRCWQAGWTGALLADDMGLGKTFQTLAFFAWIREAMRRGLVERAPLLIVAPTGLLRNWEKEHEIHLAEPGLGSVLRAYGSSLRALRTGAGSELEIARPVLDVERMAAADWVLTTYETLRDYQHSFGRIRFGVIVFDEIQKIKTPGTQVTDAAKAMQAEFSLALTGTPIENRLADLWCLMDTLHPGALGGLKDFSRRYEDRPDPEDLRRLKDALSVPGPERPAVMLRRMKDEVLEGLPTKTEHVRKVAMPDVQANAYSAVVAEARRRKDRGKMLEALQAMRAVSLAPLERSMVASDEDYVRSSARLTAAVSILDEIRDRGEKALLFVEMRAAQADLAGVLQRRYGLTRAPMIISGEVAGPRRQERVDAFQAGPPGFDVMILSPKAGGVGLTLTAANNVVHLTRWWNPAVEDQSTDRCYRIGQQRPVNVYLPMALLPGGEEHSFDSRLHALLAQKRALSRDLLMPPALSDEDARRLYEETIG
ncbi:DEAD/DEAH box helicase [Sphingomonas corticis]|jgi:hypothetical protein|uniref:DEAD/DEAH box helicase n=1 Tax=Sphingomonas corticis TaxID=2722791 RepID=A0ABX1CMD3_9SPHN|nr:DEAD/DEAH box helicase [Sphingomonas corticis]NJR77515.1 DEAD/DEAH box helicase [Sphingomonas corticis]